MYPDGRKYTMKCNPSTMVEGYVVNISAADTVGIPAAGTAFMGVCQHVEDDGYATVQMDGIMTATYTGTAPTVGLADLTANGTGGVKIAAEPTEETEGDVAVAVWVINVNTTTKIVNYIKA